MNEHMTQDNLFVQIKKEAYKTCEPILQIVGLNGHLCHIRRTV